MIAAMGTETGTTEDRLAADLIARTRGAVDEPAARAAYREGFGRLCAQLEMYPVQGQPASAVFESAAATVRNLAASCLPLGIAVAMHLYPMCVLQCMPLPWLSPARLQRARLLRTIRSRSLILANAGSDRTRAGQHPVVAHQDAAGIRIDGTFEYMSLASVADVVLFKARLAHGHGTVLCAADLRADTVRIGGWRFPGSMRLSDTSPVTFAGHRVPRGRYVVAPDAAVRCTSDYQRCWFHLFLVEMYLARLERLHQARGLSRSAEETVSLNELSRLREYALRLLDEVSSGAGIQPLTKTTSAMKLRVSLMVQSAMTLLGCPEDLSELRYIASQPTADEIILRGLGVLPQTG